MYRLRTLQALRRSSSCGRDLHRVTEGITSSIRQFQISASLAQEDNPSSTPPTTPRSRSAAANADIQNLASTSRRGSSQPQQPRRPKELVRRTDSSNPAARGGRGASQSSPRGGFVSRGGARGGRGARGNRGGARRRSRKGGEEAAFEGKEDEDEFGQKLGNLDEVTPDALMESRHDNFVHAEEPGYYAEVMQIVEDSNERAVRADSLLKEGKEKGDKEIVARAQAELKTVETDLKWGLSQLVELQDTISPTHQPHNLDVVDFYKSKVGGLPVGKAGMGHVVEDALRFLSQREGSEWIHKTKLAERLTQGKLMKFTSGYEKKQVLRLVATKEAGFQTLDGPARSAFVSNLVRGYYEDPADKDLQNPLLKDVANKTNGMYDTDSKKMLLDTIQALLPKGSATRPAAR